MSQMQITWFFFFFLHKAVDVVNVIIKEIADLISTSPSVTSILRHLYSYFIISYSRVFGIFFFSSFFQFNNLPKKPFFVYDKYNDTRNDVRFYYFVYSFVCWQRTLKCNVYFA